MKSTEKIEFVAKKYSDGVKNGVYGQSGDYFITTRELAKENEISLEYANKVMKILTDNKIITLIGKRFYITNGQIKPGSPIYKKLKLKKYFGMIVSSLQNAFISALVNEVSSVMEKQDYSLIIRISDNVPVVLEEFLENKVSGVFLDPFIAKNYTDCFLFYPLPVISLGFDITNIRRDSIIVDNYRAGQTVADRFLEISCTKFAYFGFERTNTSDERLDGFNDRIREKGYTISDDHIFLLPKDTKGNYDIKLLKDYINKLIWKTSSFDKIGIFCYHDLLAYDVVSTIESFEFLGAKRKIPDSFSVVGFDNLSIASILKPSLTTVSYPIEEIATKGFHTMLACCTDKDHIPKKHWVLFSLVERDTTKNNAFVKGSEIKTQPR